MIIVCKEDKSPKRHLVDMSIQQTLCGKPDMGMGATGDRKVTCELCEARLAERRATGELKEATDTLKKIGRMAVHYDEQGGPLSTIHAIREVLFEAGINPFEP